MQAAAPQPLQSMSPLAYRGFGSGLYHSLGVLMNIPNCTMPCIQKYILGTDVFQSTMWFKQQPIHHEQHAWLWLPVLKRMGLLGKPAQCCTKAAGGSDSAVSPKLTAYSSGRRPVVVLVWCWLGIEDAHTSLNFCSITGCCCAALSVMCGDHHVSYVGLAQQCVVRFTCWFGELCHVED